VKQVRRRGRRRGPEAEVTEEVVILKAARVQQEAAVLV